MPVSSTPPDFATTTYGGAARLWATLLVAVASEVGATLALKAALDRPAMYVVVVLGYLVAFVALAVILRGEVGLGFIYGIWSAVGVAGTAVLSKLIFGESLGTTTVVGLCLIIVGVYLIGYGSTTESGTGHRTKPGNP